VTDGKNGRILFDRPKPTAGCSASGKRRRPNLISNIRYMTTTTDIRAQSVTHCCLVKRLRALQPTSTWEETKALITSSQQSISLYVGLRVKIDFASLRSTLIILSGRVEKSSTDVL
jgi:hypothetical protein